MRASKAGAGHSAGQACHRSWNAYGKSALPSHTRGGSRMRESRTYGSVRGARDEIRVPTATPPRVHHAGPDRHWPNETLWNIGDVLSGLMLASSPLSSVSRFTGYELAELGW